MIRRFTEEWQDSGPSTLQLIDEKTEQRLDLVEKLQLYRYVQQYV